MKRCRHYGALPHRDGFFRSCQTGSDRCQDFDPQSYAGNDRSANEDGMERLLAQCWNVKVRLEAVDLSAIRVAEHFNIQSLQGREIEVGGVAGKYDHTSAGAPNRRAGPHEGPDGPVKVEVFHQPAESGALPARNDQPIEPAQVFSGP